MKKKLLMVIVVFACLLYGISGLAEASMFQFPILRNAPLVQYEEDAFLLIGRYAKDHDSSGKPVVSWVNGSGIESVQVCVGDEGNLLYAVPLSNGNFAVLNNLSETGRSSNVTIVNNGTIVSKVDLANGDIALPPSLITANDGFFAVYGISAKKDAHGQLFHASTIDKRNNEGKSEWQYDFNEHEVYVSSAISVEDGYIICGRVENQESGDEEALGFIAKLTNDGALLWMNTGTYVGETFNRGLPTADGGVVVTGTREIFKKEEPVYTTWGTLSKYNADGSLAWIKEYQLDGVNSYILGDIQEVEEGYIVIAIENTYMPCMGDSGTMPPLG